MDKKRIAFLFGAGAEICFGISSGKEFEENTIKKRKLREEKWGQSLKAYFSEKNFNQKKLARYSLSTIGSFHTRNNEENRVFLDKYFHSIINPSSEPQAFSVVFNYYWSCYYSMIKDLLKNAPKIPKSLERYIGESGELDFFKILNELDTFTKALYSKEFYDSYKSNESYYKVIHEQLHESDFICSGVITTNYFNFAQILTDNVAYVNGQLKYFEYPGYLEVRDFTKNDKLNREEFFFPFIFGQSYLKPLVCSAQIEAFHKAIEILNESDILVIVGYNLNSDDNHLNSLLHEFGKEKKIVVLLTQNESSEEYSEKLRFKKEWKRIATVRADYKRNSIAEIVNAIFDEINR